MHAATSDFTVLRPMAPAPSAPAQAANENDSDARLIAEVLARLWDLVALTDATPDPRPGH